MELKADPHRMRPLLHKQATIPRYRKRYRLIFLGRLLQTCSKPSLSPIFHRYERLWRLKSDPEMRLSQNGFVDRFHVNLGLRTGERFQRISILSNTTYQTLLCDKVFWASVSGHQPYQRMSLPPEGASRAPGVKGKSLIYANVLHNKLDD